MNKHVEAIESEEGQVLILFALFSFVLVGMLALAIDVGYLLSERRTVQNAVDAAATAGGVALLYGESDSVIEDTAQTYLEENNVAGTAPLVRVEGDSTGGSVTVEIEVPVERFFLGAVYTGDWEVRARAVAEVEDLTDGRYALVALDPPGMYVNGNMTIDVIDGGAMSNGPIARSGGANAFRVDFSMDAVGDINPNGNWEAPRGFHENRPTLENPLATVPAPSTDGLYPWSSDELPDCFNNDCELQPGLYKDLGEIRIKKTARLDPGLYIFENTRITLVSTNGRIEGDDVLLYVGGSPSNTYIDPGNGEVVLTGAMDELYDGALPGVAVWIANCSNFEARGNGEFQITGVFYAPCSYVWMHGNPSGETIRGQIIVGELDIRGTSDMIVYYEGFTDIRRLEVYLTE